MAVGFILGRSGTGKSRYCIDSIVERLANADGNRQLILLVPEQATYQAERAILSDERVGGYSSRLRVFSFERLWFQLLGKNTARPSLSRLARQMVIHRLLRENSGRLKLFGGCADMPGLAFAVAETICELNRGAKMPEDIERLISQLSEDPQNVPAVQKFADISLLMEKYLAFIEGKFFDQDVQLAGLCRAIAKADWIKGAQLWVDGFAGFTPCELAILMELLKAVDETKIALCLDASEIDLKRPATEGFGGAGLFYPTQRCYLELVEIIKKCRLELSEPVVLDKAVRFESSELAHLERNIFKSGAVKVSAGDSIRIVAADDMRQEVRFTAKQIVELVRQKRYRYRDIAVITSDLDGYEHYVRAYFNDYSVPFFIDKRRPLSQHPVAAVVCSALEAVLEQLPSSSIFSYLKSGLGPVADEDVYELENYCIAFGLGGNDWKDDRPWQYAGGRSADFDEDKINRVRFEAIGPLLELSENLYEPDGRLKKISAGQFSRIVFSFLQRLGAPEKLGVWAEQAIEERDIDSAQAHRQFFDSFVDVFDEFVEVFGGDAADCRDYAAILKSAFSRMTLALIPPGLDQVLVGSVERSRHPGLKAVFLIGATQKQFPVVINPSGVLTDQDRALVESAGFSLGTTAAEKLIEAQYLSYIAFTRPSELLYISYPVVDRSGSSTAKSQYITDLQSVFEGLREEPISEQIDDIENVRADFELADALCSRLGKSSVSSGDDVRRAEALLADICVEPDLARLGRAVSSAVTYDNSAELDSEVVKQLFSGEVRASATKLSCFASCRYKHFARYVLELKKRREFKLEPIDVGDFYHRVLDMVFKHLFSSGADLTQMADQALLEIVNRQVSLLIEGDAFISKFARHSAHNRFIISSAVEVLEDFILALKQMASAAVFRPVLSEVGFGRARGGIESIGDYSIELAGGRELFLDGKIDRIDTVFVDGKKLALVFDYKKSGSYFNWSRFYYGLDLQLPVYMLAVCGADRSQWDDCVGAFFLPVEVSLKKADLEKALEKDEGFCHKAKGLFNGDFVRLIDGQTDIRNSRFYSFYVTKDGEPYGYYNSRDVLRPRDFQNLLRFSRQKIAELAEKITVGKIDVAPYRLGGVSPCSYCEFRPVCRFDWQINDYKFLETTSKKKVLEKINKSYG